MQRQRQVFQRPNDFFIFEEQGVLEEDVRTVGMVDMDMVDMDKMDMDMVNMDDYFDLVFHGIE